MSRPMLKRLMAIGGALWLGLAGAAGAAEELPSLAAARQDSPPAAAAIHRRAALDPTVPVANPAGTVTVVEYFDYQCPYCKAIHGDIHAFLADNPDVRFVYKDWAVFGPDSVYAARAALAAKWQGRYGQAHGALMRAKGRLDPERVRAILAEAGVDLQRLDADMAANAAEIDRLLRHADDEATAIGLPGTPGFLIGGAVFGGAISRGELERLVDEARRPPPG